MSVIFNGEIELVSKQECVNSLINYSLYAIRYLCNPNHKNDVINSFIRLHQDTDQLLCSIIHCKCMSFKLANKFAELQEKVYDLRIIVRKIILLGRQN